MVTTASPPPCAVENGKRASAGEVQDLGRRHWGCLGELGTPSFAKCPLRHPQVLWDFNMNPMVPAFPDLALASLLCLTPRR